MTLWSIQEDTVDGSSSRIELVDLERWGVVPLAGTERIRTLRCETGAEVCTAREPIEAELDVTDEGLVQDWIVVTGSATQKRNRHATD